MGTVAFTIVRWPTARWLPPGLFSITSHDGYTTVATCLMEALLSIKGKSRHTTGAGISGLAVFFDCCRSPPSALLRHGQDGAALVACPASSTSFSNRGYTRGGLSGVVVL